MRLTFVWIGKTKNKHWAALEQDYLARIEHFAPCQIQIVREAKGVAEPAMRGRALEQEATAILKAIRPDAYAVLLDERSTIQSSQDLVTLISQRQQHGVKEMAFIVGGASGVAPSVRQRADSTLSLSKMTFPHEMARTVLLEQVYRAFAIIHNLPYPR
ncbi:MAG: 23S rRNA (pseudouridine(1915)-N(3))-methyltransferase RlmH [Acidobacteria bacterium]|nr:23S rRNA (pseudouridine(1915)-N(3))-methyltransferase RlmH [Acidobacteriota bacterium]